MGDIFEDNRLHLKCNCGCSALEIVGLWEEFDDDDFKDLSLSIWYPCFYAFQGGIFSNLWERLKICFKVLYKGEYLLYDMILTRDDIIKLKEYVNKLDV